MTDWSLAWYREDLCEIASHETAFVDYPSRASTLYKTFNKDWLLEALNW